MGSPSREARACTTTADARTSATPIARMVAVEAERMNSFVLWLIASSAAQAIASFTVSYGAAALIMRRQNRKRRAHLRNRLQLRV